MRKLARRESLGPWGRLKCTSGFGVFTGRPKKIRPRIFCQAPERWPGSYRLSRRLATRARYPVDLGHNFVLADDRCNAKKRDRLSACEHLGAWTERNTRFGDQIGTALEEQGMISELAASIRVALWAYAQTEAAHGLTWLRADELVPLGSEWRRLFP
jgi:hypothetical protein